MEIVPVPESDHEVNEDESAAPPPLDENGNGLMLTPAPLKASRRSSMKKPLPPTTSNNTNGIALYKQQHQQQLQLQRQQLHYKPPFVGQTGTKTKIFRPDDLLFNQFLSSSHTTNNNNKNMNINNIINNNDNNKTNTVKQPVSEFFKPANNSVPVSAPNSGGNLLKRCEKRNSIIYHDTTERRSAFSVPEKLKALHNNAHRLHRGEYTPSSLLHALQTLPVETDSPISPSPSPSSPIATAYRKRGYPLTHSSPMQRCSEKKTKTIAYCCCGSHNCKIKYIDYASEDSEGGESHFSHESTSPPAVDKSSIKPFAVLTPRSSYYIDSNGIGVDLLHEDYTIRRELKGLKEHHHGSSRDHEQNPIFILKSNSGTKFDPFMGYKDSAPIVEDLFNVAGY